MRATSIAIALLPLLLAAACGDNDTAGDAAAIEQFAILGTDATIAPYSLTLTLPAGTDVTSLAPTITFTGASVSPASGAPQNFTIPIVYTVTADDLTTLAYTAIVTTD